MNFKKNLIYFLLLISQVSLGSTSVKKLKDQVSNQSHKINKLAAQIKDFDKRIGFRNNDFLEKIKEIEKQESLLSVSRAELNQSAKLISKEYNMVKLAFDQYLLEASEDDSNHSLTAQTMHFEILEKKMRVLQGAQKSSRQLLAQINQLEQDLTARKKEEQELYSLIVELENRKREMSQNYISELEQKNQLQGQLDKAVARIKVRRLRKRKKTSTNIDFKFLMPISQFVDVQKKKRGGIDFKYNQTIPVKSPGNGRVVYVGELASYGKVLIIDHGKDVRSVLLGDIVAKVKKNGAVQKGDIVGYTMGDPGVTKSVYYEVRKNDKVQDTVKWLNSDQLKMIKI